MPTSSYYERLLKDYEAFQEARSKSDEHQAYDPIVAVTQSHLDEIEATAARIKELDEALNQLDSARHSIEVLERRVSEFKSRADALARENERLREALQQIAATAAVNGEEWPMADAFAMWRIARAALKGETP